MRKILLATKAALTVLLLSTSAMGETTYYGPQTEARKHCVDNGPLPAEYGINRQSLDISLKPNWEKITIKSFEQCPENTDISGVIQVDVYYKSHPDNPQLFFEELSDVARQFSNVVGKPLSILLSVEGYCIPCKDIEGAMGGVVWDWKINKPILMLETINLGNSGAFLPADEDSKTHDWIMNGYWTNAIPN